MNLPCEKCNVTPCGCLPLTKEAVYNTARLYGGIPHGDDANGLADIEFDSILDCTGFIMTWRDVTAVTLRDPITSLDATVVIQVQL
jgi:hypothetical protein